MTPAALPSVLLLSRDPNARPWLGTAWPNGTFDVSNPFAFEYQSVSSFAGDLNEYANRPEVYDAREGLVLSFCTHKNLAAGGRKDIDAGEVTGLVLDCDKPPLPADPEPLSKALRAAGIAHLVARKPTGKFHVIIQLLSIPVKVDEPGWKDDRRKRFRHVIEVFGKAIGRELDPALAEGAFRACNAYHRRKAGDLPAVISGYEGGALDLYKFSDLTGYSAELGGKVVRLAASSSETTAPEDRRKPDRILDDVRAALARYKREPDLRVAVQNVLAGKPFAAQGGRDSMLLRICNLMAIMEPYADPDLLAQVLAPSLDAMTKTNPGDLPPDLDDAAYKISRGQEYGRRRYAGEQETKALEERMRARISSLSRAR
jgi:hypothetical protein